MPHCIYCRARVNNERDNADARCPECHQPLYESPRDPHQRGTAAEAGNYCATHAANPAVGLCQRCGNYLCTVCRTRWRTQVVCASCIQRALEGREASPAEARAHLRQSVLGLLLGGGAWLASLGAALLMSYGASQGPVQGLVAMGFGGILFLMSPLPAILGVGQAAAAVRARGDHMILATVGLILSGLHTGVALGILTAAIAFRETA